MNTDQLCEALHKKAMKEAEDQLDKSAEQYRREIGLGGTYEIIKLTDRRDKNNTIEVNTGIILEQITKKLLSNRGRRIKEGAVNNFLESIENYQHNIADLQQYLEERE